MALTSRQRWQWRGSVDDTATTCHAIRDTRLTFVHHRRHVSSSTHHVVGSAITSACHPLTICDDCRSPTRDTRMARHRVAVVLAGGDRHRHWRRLSLVGWGASRTARKIAALDPPQNGAKIDPLDTPKMGSKIDPPDTPQNRGSRLPPRAPRAPPEISRGGGGRPGAPAPPENPPKSGVRAVPARRGENGGFGGLRRTFSWGFGGFRPGRSGAPDGPDPGWRFPPRISGVRKMSHFVGYLITLPVGTDKIPPLGHQLLGQLAPYGGPESPPPEPPPKVASWTAHMGRLSTTMRDSHHHGVCWGELLHGRLGCELTT